MIFVAAILALLIGVSLGLLGGGGSILTLPVLVYVVGVAPKDAIATSLLVVGFTSASALLTHARRGCVQWRVGAYFGGAGMLGAYGGGLVGRAIPATILLVGFALVMLAASLAMMRRRVEKAESAPVAHVPAIRVLGVGLVVGSLAGLLGAGGGFLIVPALVVLTGLGMAEAVGTSLFVITLQSFAGFFGNLGHAVIDWRVAVAVTAAAIVGSLVGARVGARVPAAALRRGFAWFVLVIGVGILAKQAPPTSWAWLVANPARWGLVATIAIAAFGALALSTRKRRARPSTAA